MNVQCSKISFVQMHFGVLFYIVFCALIIFKKFNNISTTILILMIQYLQDMFHMILYHFTNIDDSMLAASEMIERYSAFLLH